MLRAYINYPNAHISVHMDRNCASIQAQNKKNQRNCLITNETISSELQNFRDKKYPFAATAEINDMWLKIDFADPVFEMAVLEHIIQLLGNYYRPFAGLKPNIHC